MADRTATLGTTGKTQDDTRILDSEMLKYASVRIPIAVAVGLTPILISSLAYVSTFSITSQVFIGTFAGLIGMFVFQLFEAHRSTVRRHKALQVSQLSQLEAPDIRRLVTEHHSFPEWALFTEFDKVEWLNKQLDIIWPFLDKRELHFRAVRRWYVGQDSQNVFISVEMFYDIQNAISDMLKDSLQPLLNQYAMGIIQKFTLQNLTLGTKAPRFDGIKVSYGEEDETVLETKFEWTPANENLVLKIECTGPDFKAKVKDMHVAGTLKFIFKPLLETVPPFGAVLLSFDEAPDLDFNLKFLGGSLEAVPGVDKLIDNSIRTALMDSMVWPCRIVVPVAPGNWSFLELHPIAELDVTLIEAEDIMKTDIIGKSDPFCMFYVRQKVDKIKRSSTKKNKKNAVWNESFILEVEDKESQVLTVRLMDDEAFEKSQYIGSAEFTIANMKPGVAEDVWLDMVENPHSSTPAHEQSRGRVHLLIIYKPIADSDPRREAVNKCRQDTQGPDTKEGSPNTKEEGSPDEPTSSPHLGGEPHM